MTHALNKLSELSDLNTGFADLGLHPALLAALHSLELHTPTPVQRAAIGPALAGRDVLASARTGSGKTLAFGLVILQRLLSYPAEQRAGERRPVRALVLVPTRELAVQVADVLRDVAQAQQPMPTPRLKLACVYGGVAINPQMLALRGGADVLVATPGRLLDLARQNALDLSAVALLVLDEADRLLDTGFADELAQVRALLPRQHQSLMTSATLSPAVRALAEPLLTRPVQIEVDGARAGSTTEPGSDALPAIVQRAIVVDTAKRTPLLRQLIATEGWTQVLVFVATQYASDHVADKLRRQGVEAAPFHGDMSQKARLETLADFKSGHIPVIVATDLAARGIDISGLPVVVNHDLPRSAVDYQHRIGRTGRAGASGLAVSFIRADSAQAEAHFRLIEKRQGLRVPREQVAGFIPAAVSLPAVVDGEVQAPLSTGGIKGQRKSKKDKLREAAALAGTAPRGKPGG